MLKARQGTKIADPLYAKRAAAAEEAGILVGAYDFATGDNVATNVTDYLAYAGLGTKRSAALDFEDNSQSQMSAAQAYEWLDRVMQKTGRAPVIYGGNRIREQIDHQSGQWIDLAKIVRLWQCRYIKGQPADNADLFRVIAPIPPWTANFLIQYTGDGTGPAPHTVTGLQNGADLDVFNGTRDQLAATWAGAAA
jgi:lysozyme